MNTFAVNSFVAVVLMAVSSGVVAQVQPPVREMIDANGVDLLSRRMTAAYQGPSIGNGPTGLGFVRYFRGSDTWDSYLSVITSSGSLYSVTVGPATETFTESGGAFTPTEPKGSTLTLSGGVYTYTSRLGSVAAFHERTAQYAYPVANRGTLTTLTHPNGERLTYDYHSQTICTQWMGAPQGCAQSATAMRLNTITSNHGYRLSIVYVQQNYNLAAEGVPYTTPAQINLTNLADNTLAGSVAINIVVTTNNKRHEFTDALGRIAIYNIFNGHGLFSIRRAGSISDNIIVGYDTSARLVSVTQQGGSTTSYSAQDTGTNPVIRTTTRFTPGGPQRVFTFNLTTGGHLLSDRDELNRTTSYEYNAQGKLFRIIAPEGNLLEFEYDSRGNIKRTTRRGKPSLGLGETFTTAEFDTTCSNPKTCNQPNRIVDAKLNATDFTYYPEHGGVHTVTLPAPKPGAVRPKTTYTYQALQAFYSGGASGEPIFLLTGTSTCRIQSTCTNSADETKTTIGYGPSNLPNNLLQQTFTASDGTGTLVSSLESSYDSVGNLLTVDGPLPGSDDKTRTRYDSMRRVVGQIAPDPDGGGPRLPVAKRILYDTPGNVEAVETGTVVSQSDADWSTFTPLERAGMVSDAAGRGTQRSLKGGGTTFAIEQISYDFRGRVECVAKRMNPLVFDSLPASACDFGTEGTFGPDRITKFAYNDADEQISITTGFGTDDAMTVARTYTPNGRLATIADGKNNVTTFEYDRFDRPFKTIYPASGGFTEHGYDANDNVTSLRLRSGDVITFEPDNLNRIALKNYPAGGGEDIRYGYDNQGRLLSATFGDPAESGVLLTYDGLGRLDTRTSFSFTPGNEYEYEIGYDFDAAGRRTYVIHPDGFYAHYGRNPTGELASITDSTGLLATFTYDTLGRLDRIVRANGAITNYDYDAVGRLHTLQQDLAGSSYDGVSTFTRSPAHQIVGHAQENDGVYTWTTAEISAGMLHNGLNQLTQISPPVTPVTHDSLGNLESGASTFEFGYDLDNQLRSADSGAAVSLAYDPLGQLTEVMVNGSGTRFLYDVVSLIAEYSDSGTLLRRYVHAEGLDEPLVWYEGSGTTDRRYFHADERSSIVAISNNSGAGIVSFKYSPDGEATNVASSRFGYTGQMWLPQPGLSYYKSRMYSPKLGRFVQTDAIGYAGGMNLYAYVGGDPINRGDSFGFCEVPPCHPNSYPVPFEPFPDRFSPISNYDIWMADQYKGGGFVVAEEQFPTDTPCAKSFSEATAMRKARADEVKRAVAAINESASLAIAIAQDVKVTNGVVRGKISHRGFAGPGSYRTDTRAQREYLRSGAAGGTYSKLAYAARKTTLVGGGFAAADIASGDPKRQFDGGYALTTTAVAVFAPPVAIGMGLTKLAHDLMPEPPYVSVMEGTDDYEVIKCPSEGR